MTSSGLRVSGSGSAITAASRKRRAASRRTKSPPFEERLPASRAAVSDLVQTGDRPGRNGVVSVIVAANPVRDVRTLLRHQNVTPIQRLRCRLSSRMRSYCEQSGLGGVLRKRRGFERCTSANTFTSAVHNRASKNALAFGPVLAILDEHGPLWQGCALRAYPLRPRDEQQRRRRRSVARGVGAWLGVASRNPVLFLRVATNDLSAFGVQHNVPVPCSRYQSNR
jgi:hypothetical protein